MNDNAKKWVEALRSGEFAQGKNALRSGLDDNGPHAYCCLGVACELYRREVGGLWDENAFFATPNPAPHQEGEPEFLPEPVRAWLGLNNENGGYDGNIHEEHDSLVDLNDAQVPFEEIADVIEEGRPGLFRE